MAVEVSDSGPSCGNTRDIPVRHISKKNHPRKEDGDDQNNTGLTRAKRRMRENSVAESGSSSSDKVRFVAYVTAVSLIQDALYLPKDFTTTNGFNKEPCKIVLTDGGERTWKMDLGFRESSAEFYITNGWTHFCEENGKEDGSFFKFEVMRNGDMLVLRSCPIESINDRPQRNENNPQRFLTRTLSSDSLKNSRLYLPRQFLADNGIIDQRIITLVGKNGIRRKANLNQEKNSGRNSGRMSLGKGWKPTAKEYGLKIGESFVLEYFWKDGTHMLSLSKTDPESDGRQQEEHSAEATEKENNVEEMTDSSSLTRFITLSLEPEDVMNCALNLPIQFLRANGIKGIGKIIFLGKEKKWSGYLLSSDGTVAVGFGWRKFCEANGVRFGDLFTLEFCNKEDEKTPVLKFVC